MIVLHPQISPPAPPPNNIRRYMNKSKIKQVSKIFHEWNSPKQTPPPLKKRNNQVISKYESDLTQAQTQATFSTCVGL